MSEPIVYRYTPRDGAYILGLPQRDLTETDVTCVSPSDLRDGIAAGLYAEVKTAHAAPEQPKAEPAPGKPGKDNDR